MLGNVWEWCQDRHASYSSEAQPDPTGPSEGESRVIRGGSWDALARLCRAAYRGAYRPSDRSDYVGFRFCRGQGAPSR
ncbi:MAG: SUMF1/EgtB/PvdO family nonheme iron enzyme [Myxococcota bacterium]